MFVDFIFVLSSPEDIFSLLFSETGRASERERERNIHVREKYWLVAFL